MLLDRVVVVTCVLQQLTTYQGGRNFTKKKTVAWSYDMEGHVIMCVERYRELENKKTEQLDRVSTLCLDDHHFKKEELESVGDCLKMHVFGTDRKT